MLLSYAANSLIDARLQTVQAQEAVTLARASRTLLKAILPLRLERGSTLALGSEPPADSETLSVISTNRQAMVENYQRAQALLREQDVPAVKATLGG